MKKLKIKYLTLVLAFLASGMGYSQNIDLSNTRILKLEEALQLGIQNNKQLKMATTDVAIANENLSQSKIARAPYIGLNAGYNYIGNPKIYEGFYEESITMDYFNNQSSGNILGSMPIYNGGAINNKIEQQQLISNMKESVVKMTEAEVKLAIVQQYFTLEKLYRQIEVTKQNIINTDLRIKQLQSRVSNGQNLKSDLLRTELQQSRFKVSVFQDANNIKLVSNYLDILIGLPTDTVLKPEVSGAMIPTETINLEESLSEAYKNRVEIKQSEIGVQLSESSLSLTRSGFKPNVNANFMLNTQYPAQWPNYPNILNYWAAGVSLNWDISSFYNLKHRVNANKFEIEKSNTALENTKDQIDKEVKTVFVRFVESRENIITFKKDVELSLSNYKIVKSRYDNDFALISDMVDAELQVNGAKISLINANLDLIIQYYSLQYAMGKL
ncbi:TolC family protein [Flavobacterium limnophilum]|uniref:TolC family protein n=1 Tax=Flavobacterium limnophilum TaxID=3003262 RepID=UPI002482A132|nr:TolC family protein [Flavobacterium limnophilum]